MFKEVYVYSEYSLKMAFLLCIRLYLLSDNESLVPVGRDHLRSTFERLALLTCNFS